MLHNVGSVSWGKKMSYQSPPPISPRGIDQILWYQVNPIISRRKTNFWNFWYVFSSFASFLNFWRFSQIENQFVISTHWNFSGLLTSEYFCILAELGRDYHPLWLLSYFHNFSSENLPFLFYISKESLLCGGRRSLCARKRQLSRFVCCPV